MTGTAAVDIWPLAPAQQGLLYHAMLHPDAPDPYLVQCRFTLGRPVDADALRGAVEALTCRHPALRACFRHKGLDQPVQLVPRRVTVPWTEVRLPEHDREPALRRLLAADRRRRFDLTRPPLLRCVLAHHADGAELILTLHHILVDGWSMPILAAELAGRYADPDATWPPVESYREYLAWLGTQDRDAGRRAWQSVLAGLAGPTLLAPEAARPAAAAPLPGTVEMRLDEAATAAAQRRAREVGVTLGTLCQAAWALVLARMTGTDDVVFGAVVSGRPPQLPGVRDIVGLFVNTVPARVRIRPGDTVGDLLRRLQQEQLDLVPHHHVPLADVQRAAGHEALFDTVLAFENFPRTAPGGGPGRDGGPRLVEVHDATHYPLTVALVAGQHLLIRVGHRPDVVPRAEAELVAARMAHALTVLSGSPGAAAAEVDILPPRERHLLLARWNATDRAPADGTIPQRFAAQVARTPGAVAVESGTSTLTYRELQDLARHLAARLRAAGVQPGSPVGLLLPRSPELIVGQLGVLIAGGYYVPLDPSDPPARLRSLVRDTGIRVAVGDRAAPWLPAGCAYLPVQAPGPGPVGHTRAPCEDHGEPGSPAYLMFTSGSTGTPKGVLVTHRNVLELATDRRFGTDAHRRVLVHSPATFDAATYEVWVPLLHGGTAVVAPAGPLEPAALGKLVAEGAVSAVWLTAELFRTVTALAPEGLAGVREVWAGGDVLAPDAVRALRHACPATVVVNGYGPTECTTFATAHPVRGAAPAGRVPIGRPLDNTRAYVLDARLRPAPVGVPGELYLAGTGLALGYHGAPAGTAERFVANPWQLGARMYRTGDLVRWNPAGELDFLGRVDGQVKIRGHRVEPAEVEAVLERAPGVRRAVVVAGPAPTAGTQLVAYLVTAGAPDLDGVRRYAAAHLPAWLLPAQYTALPALPLTAHGKVDRAALPEPGAGAVAAGPAVVDSGGEPLSPLDRVLCDHFAAALGLPRVGVQQNFFDAGGHSLGAMHLAAAIEGALGVRLPVGAVYEAPTPAALADRLRRDVPDHGLAPVLTLRADGTGDPVFFLHPGLGLGWSYAALLPHLPPGRPLYAIQSPLLSGATRRPPDVAAVAEAYLPLLREIRPHGPYVLVGRSFGGLLAYELAARLQADGHPVALAAVLDAVPGPQPPPDPPDDVLEQEVLRLLRHAGGPVPPATGERLTREAVFAEVRAGAGPLRGSGADLLARIVDAGKYHIRLALEYRPTPYHGPITLFCATADPGPTPAEKAAAWRRAGAEVRVIEIDCTHSNMLQPTPAAQVGAALGRILQEHPDDVS